jgi:hypothetical protein
MPRYVFEKLRLPLDPTGMFLELGDNSIHYPFGIAEDVPVKVLTVYSSSRLARGQVSRRSQGTLLPSSGEPKVSNPWKNV